MLHTITIKSINLTITVIVPKAGLLSSFLQEGELLPLFLLGGDLLVVFNIEVSGTAFLLKP